MSEQDHDNPRRDFLRKTLTLIPVVTVASTGLGMGMGNLMAAEQKPDATPTPAKAAQDYQPSYFTAEEWTFVNAAVARLIPADSMGPGALEAGAPEFIDRQMGTTYASGGLWYMQGPFVTDAPAEMGYQLKLVPKQIYRLGIAATDAWCKKQAGKVFAQLDTAAQESVLTKLESGEIQFDDVPSKAFFALLIQNTKEGFFSDPVHGGNKGLVGWTLVGFPGARADFMDWVERNEAYPYPAVSIRGERA